ARLFAVAVQTDGFLPDCRAQELVESHVRTLTRSVDREVAERDRGHAVIDIIKITELFGSEFRDAVRRERLRQRVFAHRHRAGDERLHANSPLTRGGKRHGRPSRSIVTWTVCPVTSTCPSAGRTTSYLNATRAGEIRVPSTRISSSSSYRAGCLYSQCASITG